MPEVIYASVGDEIVDLVEKVRAAGQDDVALVVNRGTVGLQTPLNVRLLQQLGGRAGKTVSVISGDPYVQQLSRGGGLPTYASVPAFERGIQTVRPHDDDPVALAPPPPPLAGFDHESLVGSGIHPAGAAAPAAAAATSRVAPADPGRRGAMYFAIAGLVLLGLVLLLVVAPSAKVTITLVGTPLSANPTIQGSTDAGNAGKQDHIVTAVVTSDQSSQFQATPTGQKPVPAAAAGGQIVFQTDLPGGAIFTVMKGEEFDTQDSTPIRFYATQDTTVTAPGPSGTQTFGSASNPVPIADGTPEAKGNVAVNTITKWPGNRCQSNPLCPHGASDLTSTNPAPTKGGADATTQVTASQADVAAWTAQVTQAQQTLTNQVNSDMQSKAGGRVFAKDPGGKGTTVSCDVNPAVPAADAPFTAATITIACHGKAAVYSAADVTTDANNDLGSQVAQGDTLDMSSVNCTKPQVTQAADDGTVVLSIQCTGFSRPNIDLNGLKSQITGKSAGEAKNIIQHRLDHVRDVSISQSPIPLFWLPFFAGRIEIDESFVAQSGT